MNGVFILTAECWGVGHTHINGVQGHGYGTRVMANGLDTGGWVFGSSVLDYLSVFLVV